MPRLSAYQLRLLAALSLVRVTIHCLQLVRFVGEAASTGPASTKRAGAANADLASEPSGKQMARAIRVMSAQSAKRLRRRARTLDVTMIVSSLLLRKIFPIVI